MDITRFFNKLTIVPDAKQIKTEDTGKEFEMSICLAYEIDYVGKYKYRLIEFPRLKQLTELFPGPLIHIAKAGSRYDFQSETGEYLSAKSNKSGNKVCPQVIGQASKKKFCEYFKIEQTVNLKEYIFSNIKELLGIYFDYTFDASIIYYNKKKDSIKFIKTLKKIDWNVQELIFTRNLEEWNESNSIKLNTITIGEFQFHNNRDCIKFRWNFEKIIFLFSEHFNIINII